MLIYSDLLLCTRSLIVKGIPEYGYLFIPKPDIRRAPTKRDMCRILKRELTDLEETVLSLTRKEDGPLPVLTHKDRPLLDYLFASWPPQAPYLRWAELHVNLLCYHGLI